ncbi:11887_t:CDS:2 [Dentiscutata heterogama]|uniref:11887_t:CDS:1 n=1 Tax=Dentiscutata heterogama TaxID=1316150 RepID=A0ACA9LUW9_9GLOM|nr:11887_t:CDS:2 [Dentiscutata heterogama]
MPTTRPYNIREARRKGYVDNIEAVETKLKLITLFRENNNYIPLNKTPFYYFARFNRALIYMGKLKYAITNEMNTILSLHETINCGIIVRLSEPLQQERNDILQFNNSFNQQHEKCQITLQGTEDEVNEYENNKQKVKRWLEEIKSD